MTHKELLQGCRNNNRKAQGLLFKEYEKKVLAISRRYTSSLDEAKDIQQDAFIKIFRSLRSGSAEIQSLDKWIYRLVVNAAVDFCRKQRRIDDAKQLVNLPTSVEPSILDTLDEEELMKLIQSIPNPYRLIFNLYIVEGLSHREIGEKLQLGESTSRAYLTKAKEFLKDKLTQSENKRKNYG